MAYASITYTSASGTTFALTNSSGNPIQYLRQSDIAVTVNGTLKTQGTDYTFNTAGTAIVLTTSVTSATVVISRTTSITDATVSFTAGSTLTAQDLNNSDKQNRFALQEFSDIYDSLRTGTGDLSALGGFIGSSETWVSDNAHAATTGAVDARVDSKIDTALTTDVVAGTDISITDNSPSSGQITIAHNVAGANTTVNNSDGTVLQDITVTAQGHVTSVGSYNLDNRYYTETESDAKYWNNTSQTVDSTETWVSDNNTIATTGAVNNRIVALVDEVGGFIAIANETVFPNNDPDEGVLVSITNVDGLTWSGGGVSTNATRVDTTPVTITGIQGTGPAPADTGMIVVKAAAADTYTFIRFTLPANDVLILSGNAQEVVDVGTNINDVITVANNIADVNTVAADIADVTTVATDIANVNTFATNIGDVNNFANVYRISATAPTTSLDAGDLWWDTTTDLLKIYDGSSWTTAYTLSALPLSGGTMTGDIVLSNQTDLRFGEATANGSNYVAFQAPSSITSNITWTLPSTDAAVAGYALVSDGTGTLSWAAAGGGATGGGSDKVFFENDQTVTTNYTITNGKNAMSAGPVTVNSGVTVTIPSGSNWVIV